jgi:signal transduction histidine kinase
LDTETSSEIITLVLIGTLGGLIIAGSLVFFVVLYNKRVLKEKHELVKAKLDFQKQLLSASLAIEERERKDIAQNLHDDIGALLSLIRINESQIVSEETATERQAQLIDSNKKILNSISESVRNITNRLYSPVLSRFGLIEALKDVFGRFNEAEDFSIQLYTRDDFSFLEQNYQIQLYRSILEIINNGLKHSKANSFEVSLTYVGQEIVIEVVYNGAGLAQERYLELIKKQTKGLGLSSLQSRIDSMDGTIVFLKDPAEKTNSVTINIPYEKDKSSDS